MAKRKRKKINMTKLFFRGITFFFCVYVVFVLFEQQQESAYLRGLEASNAETIQQLQEELLEMNENISNASSDGYIESMARKQLKMIGPEEILFIDMGKKVR